MREEASSSMSSRFAAFVAAVSLSVVGLVVGPAFAESGVSVSITGTDFLAGNNGNGLWRIGITNSHPDTTAAGPVTAVVTVPAPQIIDTAVGSVGWTCAGAGTQTANCTINLDIPPGGGLPTLQLPVVLPSGVTGTATVSVTVTAGAAGELTASGEGSAPIRPAYEPGVDPSDPAPGVDLSVDAPFTKVRAGAVSTQQIIVRNTGTANSTGPTTVVVGLTGAQISAGTGSGWSCVRTTPTNPSTTWTCTHAQGVAAGGTLPVLTMATGTIPSVVTRLTYAIAVTSPDADAFPRDNETAAWPLVVSQANLTLNKTVQPTIPAPGSRVTYYLDPRVEPYGSVVLGPLTMVDPLPVGSTFVSATGAGWTCDFDATAGPAGTVRCHRPDAVLGRVAIVVDLDGAALKPGDTVINTATVSSGTTELFTDDNSASVSVTLGTPAVDLAIFKNRDYDPSGWTAIREGDTFRYSLKVTNFGPSFSRSVVTVVDQLPAEVDYVSAVGDGWACSFDPVTRELTCTSSATVPNGTGGSESSFPTIIVSVTALRAPETTRAALISFANSAKVSGEELDPSTTNNTSTTWVGVELVQDLGVVKTADGPFFQGAGAVASYLANAQLVAGAPRWNTWKISLTNYDTRPIVAPSFNDTLPLGVSFTDLSAPPTGEADYRANWRCSSYGQPTDPAHGFYCSMPNSNSWIAPGETQVVYAVTYVDPSVAAGTTLTNTVTHSLVGRDSNPANDVATATAVVQPLHADLITRKYGPYQSTRGVYYSLGAENSGPSNYKGAFIVTDILPEFLEVDRVEPSTMFTSACVTSTTADGRPKVECTVTDSPVMTPGQAYQVAQIFVKLAGQDPVWIDGNCMSLGWGNTTPPEGSGQHLSWYESCTVPYYFDPSIKPLDLEYTKTATMDTIKYFDVYARVAGEGQYVQPGSVITYRLQVKNTGPAAWTSQITLEDWFYQDIYQDVSVVSVTPQAGVGWTCDAPTGFQSSTSTRPSITCRTDTDLPVGEAFWVEVTVKSESARSLNNIASPINSFAFSDSNNLNNQDGVQLPALPQSDIGVTKSFGVYRPTGGLAPVSKGGPIPATGTGLWTIPVKMHGSVAKAPIVVTDTLPPGFTVTKAVAESWGGPLPFDCTITGDAATGQTVTCTYDDTDYVYKPAWNYSDMQLAQISINVSWSLPSGTHTNQVGVSAQNEATSGLPKTDSFPVTVPAIDASLRKVAGVTTSVPVGGLVPFSLTVTNAGGDPLTSTITVTDTLPAGLGLVDVQGIGWTCLSNGATPPVVTCTSDGDISSGMSSTTIVLVAEVLKTPIYVTNTAVVAVDGDTVRDNNTATAGASSTGGRLADDLKVTTMLGGRILPGAEVTWNVDIANVGVRVVTGTLELTVRVPDGLTPTGASGDGWLCTIDRQILTCHNETDSVPGVAYPGLAIALTADPDLDGTEVFVLTAMLGADGLVDANVSDNQADEIALSSPLPIPSIDVVKLTNGIDVYPAPAVALTAGADVTWTYLVSNTGNRPLTDIVLTDDQEGAITCPQTTLAVDEHMVCTVTGTAVAGTYVNIASVTAAGPGPSGPTTVGDQDASSYVATNPEVPGELPTTGAPTQSVVLLAVAMIAAGLGLIRIRRYRGRHEH